MITTRLKRIEDVDCDNSSALVRQLEREISCLERQLCRLKVLDSRLDKRTESTYQEMIACRKDMLSELSY